MTPLISSTSAGQLFKPCSEVEGMDYPAFEARVRARVPSIDMGFDRYGAGAGNEERLRRVYRAVGGAAASDEVLDGCIAAMELGFHLIHNGIAVEADRMVKVLERIPGWLSHR